MSQKTYWKSSEHKKAMENGDTSLGEEFTSTDGVLKSPVERRDFLKVMGASLALAGVTACAPIRRPVEQITPYAEAPEGLIPGRPTYFATSMQVGFDVIGLLVESHEGRPTKIEGNPKHPQSLGATSAIHQASVLELYDPDRLQHASRAGKKISPVELAGFLADTRKKYLGTGGKGLAFLTGDILSPSLARAFQTLKSQFPEASFHRFEPVNGDAVLEGSRLVSGKSLIPTHRLENADIVVSFDSDFLANEPESVAAARTFASRRDPEHKAGMNRLYVFEPQFSVTGGKADHRVRVKPSRVAVSLAKLAVELSKKQAGILSGDVLASFSGLIRKASSDTTRDTQEDKTISALAEDLLRSKGKSLLLAGRGQGSHVHALVMTLNQALGNSGRTVFYRETPDTHPGTEDGSIASIKNLISKIDKGSVETLFILGGNPVYNTPADLSFADKAKRVGEIVHLTLAENETSELAKTLIPESHFLESWGDARSLSGTTGLIQPLITPLYESLSCLETILLLSGSTESAHDFVQNTWRASAGLSFEKQWRRWLQEGVVNAESGSSQDFFVNASALASAFDKAASELRPGLELALFPHRNLFDGRFSNSAWLQELPDPITKLTWGNVALISPAFAKERSLSEGSVIEITSQGRSIKAPVFVAPGQAGETISLSLGGGRKKAGRVGTGFGANAFLIQSSLSPFILSSIEIRKTGRSEDLASVQEHRSMENRPLYREGNLDEYNKKPTFAQEKEDVEAESLFQEKKYDTGHQWGMVIDLGKCTGCNACTVACQSENNIPSVGKESVVKGREMHWIRMDRYFVGEEESPRMVSQPVACVQCENAPCEQVCPVNATSHSSEGTSDIAYNRCVGMRYCANNCPYKARRFNFFDYHQKNPQSVSKERNHLFDLFREPAKTTQMQFNPDVTVRMRGVMEKCTYCVQRTNAAKFDAKNENRNIRDGELMAACQQACPSGAIDFGDLLDNKSRIAAQKKNPRNYAMLGELNVKPRTTYLAAVRNPHPSLG